MESRKRTWTWVMFALLACTALIPLTAPVFPSQDGPVHLYYVDVLRGILTHSAPYAQNFQIKSLLTPYALEYYSLYLFEFLFSPVFSEKLLIVGYIFVFGLGFRYLVETVAGRESPWIVAGIPFSLNMLVYMGFLNYSTAMAILLFQCGFWIRYSRQLTVRRGAALFCGLLLMLLTHPVPVAVFMMFAGLFLVADTAFDVKAGGTWGQCLRARRTPLLVLASMGMVSLAWVGLFLRPGKFGTHNPNFVEAFGWFSALAAEVQLYHATAFSGLVYRSGPMALVGFTAFVLIAFSAKRNVQPAAKTLLVSSAACFLLFCIVPERINGSFFFAERFPILFVLFLLAGTAAVCPPHSWNLAVGALAVAVTVGVLFQQWTHVARIGSQITAADKLPLAKPGSVGLIIAPDRDVPTGLEFNPYMWSAVHYFRRSRAILANDPWMDLPLIMLAPTHPDRWSYFDPDDAIGPFVSAISNGVPINGLDLVVRMGPPDFEIDSLLRRSGWTSAGHTDGLNIYLRP